MSVKKILFCMLLLVIGCAVFCFYSNPRITPLVKAVQKCSPSVVNISTEQIVLLQKHPFWSAYGNSIDLAMQDFFYRNRIVQTMNLKSVGSGVILTKDAVIVTNAHVVHMASKIYVTLHDGTTLPARPLLINQQDDLALIQIDTDRKFKPQKLIAPDTALFPGETVISIGNPFGLGHTVTAGVLSGNGRRLVLPKTNHEMNDLLQIDAPINPGSSGGALLNLKGELIGINLAVVENAQNVGFAVSAKKVRELLSTYQKT